MKKHNLNLGLVLLSIFAIGLSACGANPGGSENTSTSIQEEVEVESINVTTPPTKTEYVEGDLFDPAGMVVTATLSNGSTKVLTTEEYSYSPKTPLTVSDTSVRIVENESRCITSTPIKVNAIVIEGEPNFKIEAENCVLEGLCGGGSAVKDKPLSCANNFSTDGILPDYPVSGELVRNFGREGNKLSFTFTSNKAMMAKFVMRIATRPTGGPVSSWVTIKVNDVEAGVDFTLPNAPSGVYNQFYDVPFNAKIANGNNTFVLDVIASAGNLDCFTITAPGATLTNTTVPNVTHAGDGLHVVSAPTKTTTGLLSDACTLCGKKGEVEIVLPILNKTDYTYKEVTAPTKTTTGKATYTYKTKYKGVDKEFVFEETLAALESKSFVLEAETATLAGTSASGDNKGSALDCRNITTKDHASGGKALIGVNVAGDTITLNFNANRAAQATMMVTIAARVESNKGYSVSFKNMLTTTVNGVELNVPEDIKVVPTGGNESSLSDYFEFHDVEIGTIDVKEGANTIVFTVTDDVKAGNMDKVTLTTEAEITNTSTPMPHHLGNIVDVAPTYDAVGYGYVGVCDYCGDKMGKTEADRVTLPKLDDPRYTSKPTHYATISIDGNEFTVPTIPDYTSRHVEDIVGTASGGAKTDFFNPAAWNTSNSSVKPTLEDNNIKVTSKVVSRIDNMTGYRDEAGKIGAPILDDAKYATSSSVSEEQAELRKEYAYAGETLSFNVKPSADFGMQFAGNSKARRNSSEYAAISFDYNATNKTFTYYYGKQTKAAVSAPVDLMDNEFHKVDFIMMRDKISGAAKGIVYLLVDDKPVIFTDITETTHNESAVSAVYPGLMVSPSSNYGGYIGFYMGNIGQAADDISGQLLISKKITK